MFLGRRLAALCSLPVSSPVWPLMIFFMSLFVLPFPFIRSFSLAGQTKAKSFFNGFESLYPRHLLLPFYSSACSKQNFVSFRMSWALSTSQNLSWAFAFLTSFAQIFIILYIHSLVSSDVLWRSELTRNCLRSHRLLSSKEITSISSSRELYAIS